MPVKKQIKQRALAAVILAGFSVPLTAAAAHPDMAQDNDLSSLDGQHVNTEVAAEPQTVEITESPAENDYVAPAEDTEPKPAPQVEQPPAPEPEPVTEAPEPVAEQPSHEPAPEAPAPAVQQAPEPVPESIEKVEPEVAQQESDTGDTSDTPSPQKSRMAVRTLSGNTETWGEDSSNDVADVGDDEGPGENDTDTEPQPPTYTEVNLPGGGKINVGNSFTQSDDDDQWYLDISGEIEWDETSDIVLRDTNGNEVTAELSQHGESYRIAVENFNEASGYALHFEGDKGRQTMIVGSADGSIPAQVITGGIKSQIDRENAAISLSNLATGVNYELLLDGKNITVTGDAEGKADINLTKIPGFTPGKDFGGTFQLKNSLGLHGDETQKIVVAYSPPKPEPEDPKPDPKPEPEPGDGEDKEPGKPTDPEEPVDPAPVDPEEPGTDPGDGGGVTDPETPGGGEPGTEIPGGEGEGDPDTGTGNENGGGIETPSPGDGNINDADGDDGDLEEPSAESSPSDDSITDAFGDLRSAMDDNDQLASQSDELPLASDTAGSIDLESATSDSLLSRLQDRDSDEADDTDDSELDVFRASPHDNGDSQDYKNNNPGPEKVAASSGWFTGLLIALGSGIITLFAWLVLGKKRRGDHASEEA